MRGAPRDGETRGTFVSRACARYDHDPIRGHTPWPTPLANEPALPAEASSPARRLIAQPSVGRLARRLGEHELRVVLAGCGTRRASALDRRASGARRDGRRIHRSNRVELGRDPASASQPRRRARVAALPRVRRYRKVINGDCDVVTLTGIGEICYLFTNGNYQ
jgi:hypothetical protein